MKKILLFAVITAFLLISCNEELITVVDEYNAPYDVQAIPGDNKVSITFWSGIIASDFAAFVRRVQKRAKARRRGNAQSGAERYGG